MTNYFFAKKRNVKIKLNHFDSMPSKLFGDKMRIIQVSNNLVGNAVAYATNDKKA
jgi:nitrogen-specific signal transduction histidine kinase